MKFYHNHRKVANQRHYLPGNVPTLPCLLRLFGIQLRKQFKVEIYCDISLQKKTWPNF